MSVMPENAARHTTDVLNRLLSAEMDGIFRVMEECSPHVGRMAGSEVRRTLSEMAQTSRTHAEDLYELIESLGGVPAGASVQSEEQYLAYLSLKFLLPKVTAATRDLVRQYEIALRELDAAPAEVRSVLEDHLARHRIHLGILETAGNGASHS